MTTTSVTRIIAGHELSLTPGRRYLATRPMARDLGQLFDVKNSGETSFEGRIWE